MVDETFGDGSGYPGAGLGRPPTGPGSIARPGRRMLSLLIDWAICVLIVRGFGGASALHPGAVPYPVLVLVVENFLLLPTAGATVGQRLVGLQTLRLDGGRLGVVQSAVRAVLVGLWLPVITIIWQRDLRGAHDLAAGAVVTRAG